MDNPFSNDGQNPFQTPYQAPVAPENPGPGIKPFAAVDLAPSAPNKGSMPALAPSPFLEGGLSKAFSGRDMSANGAAQATPGGSPFANKPNPMAQPVVDFSPAPLAPPAQPLRPQPMEFTPAPVAAPVAVPVAAPKAAPAAAARQSQIMALADMDRTFKPEFFLTSTATVDGYTIQEYLGLVSIEVVVPKDLLFRNPAPHGELHRLKAAEDQLQRVKVTALEELSARAKGMGADGIVGLTLQFSQFDTIVCLCSAVGTAVKLSG